MTATEIERAAPPDRSTQPAVLVRGLVKSYGERVVDDVDLTIARGECFALLGPNGAGKTTTIEILEGFRRRDDGEVLVLGTDPARADRAWRARVGIVGQSAPAAVELTVSEIVEHFAHYHAAPRRSEELIAAVGLSDKRGARVAALSGGLRRRLDVALGVQGAPELLFLDEPTTGMDPVARRGFWALIEALKADGTTIVLTTHYLDEAAHLADRVGVLAGGRLVDVAVPDALGASLALPTEVRWTQDGAPRAVRTEAPTAVLRELLCTTHGELPGLSVVRPTLEDAYLALVGMSDTEAGRSGPTSSTPTAAGGPS